MVTVPSSGSTISVNVQVPLPGEVSEPADSSAPVGTPEMVTESVSEPS